MSLVTKNLNDEGPPNLQLMGAHVRFLMTGAIDFDHPLEIRHANSKTQIISKCIFKFDPGRLKPQLKIKLG